jgi:VCBS repeat-containing protein
MLGRVAPARRAIETTAIAASSVLALLLPAVGFAQVNAVNNSYTVAEDTALTVPAPGVLGNDVDLIAPLGNLTAQQFSNPSNGTVTSFAANGAFTYHPNPNFSGTDSFTYTARDGQFTDLATVTITVTAVNDPPTAVADSYSVNEDTTLNVSSGNGLRANDTDVETTNPNQLTVRLGTPPATGTLSLNANSSFTYTPAPNFAGVVTFTYVALDNGNPPAQSAPATVTITVNGVNDPPTAVPNSYTTSEDIVLSVAATGVLANDTDPEDGTLTAQLVTNVPASTGTLALNPNGSFTYTPSPGFAGTASFTYRAVDNGTPPAQSAAATVTITVTQVNDAPTAANDTYSVAEDTTLTVPARGVLANDLDPDAGDAITAQLVATTANGTLTLSPNGGFTYTPRANFSGTDSFTYRAVDNGVPPAQSGVATVTITITAANDAPVAAPDSYSTQEDAAPLVVAAPGVLANDTDADSAVLTARLLTAPASASGTLTLNPNGSFTFTPRANFAGTATFTYAAVDNGTPPAQSNAATVTITVTAVNDPPVAVPDTYSATEDTTLSVPAATGVLANDTDIDSAKSALTASVVSNVSKGTLSLSANGSFNYTPSPEYSGPDSFTYRVSDGASPPGLSQPATVTITVAAVNDAPKPVSPGPGPAVPDQTAAEAIPFTLNLAPFFTDPENDPISFPNVANLPSGLTATPAGLISGTPTLQTSVRECDKGIVDLTVSDGKSQLLTKFCLRVLKAGRADLALSVSAAPAPAVINQPVVWTFLIENKSPEAVGNISLNAVFSGAIPFTLPPSPAPGCVTTPQGTLAALGCTGGPVPGNGSVSIAVTGSSALPGDILTTATIAITDPLPLDESPANNSASAALSIAERVAAGPAQKLVAPDGRGVAAGDFNGDGFLDLALVRGAGQSTQIYPNVVDPADPGGRKRAFAVEPVSLGDRGLGGSVAAADFDGDGAADLVVANRSGEPNRIFRNPRNGSFALTLVPDALGPTAPTSSSNAVAVGDLNGDSLTDIVFANSSPNPVFINQGAGTFQQAAALGNADSRDVVLANLFGDAQPELVFANADGDADIYTYNAVARRYESTLLPTGPTTSVAAGDFDADGRTDLVFGRLGQPGVAPSNPVFRNTQVATGAQFVLVGQLGAAPTNDVLAVDTNADGAVDVVAINATGGHRVYVNDGTGQFVLHPEQFVSTGALSSLAGRLGADERLDLAVAGTAGLEVFYNDGRGNFGRGDTGSPVIQLQGQPSVQVTVETAYTDAGATATDDIDGVITSKITVTNPVNTAILGTYTVTYAVADSSGNAAVPVTRTVTVAPRTGTGGGGGGTFDLGPLALVAALWLIRMLRERRFRSNT